MNYDVATAATAVSLCVANELKAAWYTVFGFRGRGGGDTFLYGGA